MGKSRSFYIQVLPPPDFIVKITVSNQASLQIFDWFKNRLQIFDWLKTVQKDR